MDFWRTVLVVFRRWYVVLPAFLLAIGASAAVYASVPVVYISTSVLVLTTPLTGATENVEKPSPDKLTNPFLNFDKGLSTSASLLIQALSTPEMAAELGAAPGSGTTYQVTNGSSNPELLTSGPFVFIAGESEDAGAARDIVKHVADRARVELQKRQTELNAPSPTFITVGDVVPPTTPEAQGGSRTRAAAAALGLGCVAALASAFGAESFAAHRRKRPHRKTPVARKPKAAEPIGV
ncbi:hypothetical protein Lesp02_10840 [Lentzea sp. NBRC 105346]|uniref:hypothetical protein n=1 Tax=Lentzea sp. NBRC 105346 TaxID=3032205 RepID=UPI0024A0FA64|nr:hypothetical protein [Lentzea sp. NBRC 105346]GLZ28894.1 hypothetical protein Lesp02_10840 [Lentzea sp. NBRC 105346]